MTANEPLPDVGRFKLPWGGWFGGQVGGTVWLLIGAVVLAEQDFWIAVSWVGCFVFANAIGTWLWWRRDRIRPFLAMQLLLAVCAASSLLALLLLDFLGPEEVRMNLTWEDGEFRLIHLPGTLRPAYFFLLWMAPTGIAVLAVLDWRLRRARSGN